MDRSSGMETAGHKGRIRGKGMINFDELTRVAQMDVDEAMNHARQVMRPLFVGHEFWIIVGDLEKAYLFDKIYSSHYRNAGPEDFHIVLAGGFFFVAARKRRMFGFKLASLLRQAGSPRINEKEIVSQDVLICTQPGLTEIAALVAVAVLRDSDGEESAEGITSRSTTTTMGGLQNAA